MSNIAGLLSNLMPSPQQADASARGPSGQPNGATPGKGGTNGFDAILSKMGQNGAAANAKAFAQLSGAPGNPAGTAKPGTTLPGANAADDANTIIENAIATDAQTQDAAAARTAASKLMSNAAATAASAANAKTAAANAATRAEKTALDSSNDASANELSVAKPATNLLPGAPFQRPATGAAAAQPASPSANSKKTTAAQLSESLAATADSDTPAPADAADAGQTTAPKSRTPDPTGMPANNIAANAAAIVADIVAAGQPAVPSGTADKTNTSGKAGRGANADGAGRTTSKQDSSTAKTDAPAGNATLDPSLQSVVLASAGLDIGTPVPPQPSLPVESQQAGVGPSDPNLKAIMTASAIAEANSAAKMSTGGQQADDADGPTILRVLSTETHFAPAAQLSPVQQIADTVIGALPNPSHPFGASAAEADAGDAGPSASASAASASSAPNSTTSTIAGPVKILNLQLEPPSLGTVTINLSLSDGGLNVQLAASQVSTMTLIDKDKDTLSNQLRESGYSIAGVGVTISIDGSNVPNQGSATHDQLGQSAAQGGQTMSNGGSSNGNGSSQSGGHGGAQQALPQTATDYTSSLAARSPAAGGLYI